jgi:hypothetical protein
LGGYNRISYPVDKGGYPEPPFPPKPSQGGNQGADMTDSGDTTSKLLSCSETDRGLEYAAIDDDLKKLGENIDPKDIFPALMGNSDKEIKIPLSLFLKLVVYFSRLKKTEKDCFVFEKAFEKLWKDLKEVYEVYQKEGRQDQRLREVARILGLTLGKRTGKISPEKLYYEYTMLLSEYDLSGDIPKKKKKLTKWEALEELAKKYGIQSKEACYQHIKPFLKQIKDESGGIHGLDGIGPNDWPGGNLNR